MDRLYDREHAGVKDAGGAWGEVWLLALLVVPPSLELSPHQLKVGWRGISGSFPL